jgi:hypothetical protein
MCTQKSLSLSDRLELPHPSLPDSGRFMRLLSPIVFILLSTVDRLGDQLSMSYAITAQLVSHDLSRFTAVITEESPEKPFCCSPISPSLKEHINNLTVLIYGPP